MFNLEQSIVEWRRQMLAAGIKSLALEELESHLREEIEGQIQLGMSEQKAFEATVLQIGQGQELQTEFAKERGWRELLQGNISKRAKGLLWCWVAFCLIAFKRVREDFDHSSATLFSSPSLIISLAIIAIAAYLVGTLWSFFLVNTTKQVRGTIRGIVNLGNYLFIALVLLSLIRPSFHIIRWDHIIFVPLYFNLFTSVLLNSPPSTDKKAAS